MERGDDRLAAPAGAAVKHFQGKVDGGGTIAFDVQFKNGNPKTASEFAFSRIPVTCDDRSGRINFAYHGSAQVSDGKFSYRFSSFKASFHGKLNDKGTKASGKVSYGPNELSGHPNCSTGGPHAWTASP